MDIISRENAVITSGNTTLRDNNTDNNINKYAVWGSKIVKVVAVVAILTILFIPQVSPLVAIGCISTTILVAVTVNAYFKTLINREETIENQKMRQKNILNLDSIAEKEIKYMPGFEPVQKYAKKRKDQIIMNNYIEDQGYTPYNKGFHIQIVGNSGTGKTKSAYLLAAFLFDIGAVISNKVSYLSRENLTSIYLNGTEQKTRIAVENALDGVVIIDEAYSLNSSKSFALDGGDRATTELLLLLEEYKDRIVFIFLGYEGLMTEWINKNQGLNSRIKDKIVLQDYNEKQLLDIFKYHCKKTSYEMSEQAFNAVRSGLKEMKDAECINFGNARSVINFLENIIEVQKSRLVAKIKSKKALDVINKSDIHIDNNKLFEITLEDVEEAKNFIHKKQVKKNFVRRSVFYNIDID